jgi:hypothetical protein
MTTPQHARREHVLGAALAWTGGLLVVALIVTMGILGVMVEGALADGRVKDHNLKTTNDKLAAANVRIRANAARIKADLRAGEMRRWHSCTDIRVLQARAGVPVSYCGSRP